ncbi:hypothetical protein D3C72_2595620 [compost metagenome]
MLLEQAQVCAQALEVGGGVGRGEGARLQFAVDAVAAGHLVQVFLRLVGKLPVAAGMLGAQRFC